METSQIVIDIKNLNKTFKSYDTKANILTRISNVFSNKNENKICVIKNFSIQIKKGEFIGIIGRNGSGKSTLLKLIMGSINYDSGSQITTKGKMIRLALGIGFDPNLSARDNIYVNGTILGLSFKKIGEKLDEIIKFAELVSFIDTPIRFYSSGMKSKLSFAIALHTDADIILIDEFFGAVGDEVFKEKSQKAFEENILKGKTIIHVSHSMSTIKKHCDRVIVLKNGKGKIFGIAQDAIKYYTNVENPNY